ncbi:hypothetical protein HanIR_Chr14g0699011 [Helianthus annuus]|nr:hypothetical protein HanIR_Chr14g0699011 [Helianthus annuus]
MQLLSHSYALTVHDSIPYDENYLLILVEQGHCFLFIGPGLKYYIIFCTVAELNQKFRLWWCLNLFCFFFYFYNIFSNAESNAKLYFFINRISKVGVLMVVVA